jgi:hypothetical protein
VLTLLLSFVLTANATAQTVVNGSFEADVVPPGLTSISGSGLTGWTVGADGGYPVLAHETYPIDVPDGSQAIMLGEYTGDNISRSTYIEQTISGFISGHTYELSFAIASGNSGCGGECGQAAVTVSFPSGSSTGAATFVAPVSGGVYGLKDWARYTYSFLLANSSITVRFAIAPPVGFMYEGVGIDAVAVKTPTVHMTANGSDGPVTLAAGEALQIEIMFDAPGAGLSASNVGIGVLAPFGMLWLGPTGFGVTPAVLYSGPLPDFGPVTLFSFPSTSGFPSGSYYWFMLVQDPGSGAVAVDAVETVLP